ncbi:Kae1-associated serine/threonine protein kinase [archaeon]|nr:Kae1-associated serine/threonine protein kinase [archaeon]MBT6182260.1 Kae1-associated serine/threonine protein kinase [archaeon]MBT6606197.1 Kae1-associated serine/threonine protein kinase [archaeon]MBT7251634.1 Kae1-associated serine/threonine protein kinase [archaeon]MBT7661076.1 Kae1-associated serine/threonine protein kinase [archaeon]
MEKLLSQGAEAKIYLAGNVIAKQRVVKGYRHETLDTKIRVRRTRGEGKILEKAYALGIKVPKVLGVEKFNLELEYIVGDRLSEALNDYDFEKQVNVIKKLGEQVSKLHANDLIHGDLTTSNVLLSGEDVFIIDFGLGFVSKKIEDKAVDLHLLKQALEAKHFGNWEKLFESFLKGYYFDDAEKIVERLEVVEKRGRYKH